MEHELDIVGKMVKTADKHGLGIEVTCTFARFCAETKSVTPEDWATCAERALLEWDI